MKKIYFNPILLCVFLFTQFGCNNNNHVLATRQEIWFHPMTAQADRAGLNTPSTALVLRNDDTFGAGLILTAGTVVQDNDLEWVNLDLPLPVLNAGGEPWKIDSLEVCYDISTTTPDLTFISQVRLTEMTTPNSATIRYDDGTNLNSATPICYVRDVGDIAINGAYGLAFRIAIGNTNDRIRIGAIRVVLKT